MNFNLQESSLVVSLFVLYLLLWKIKNSTQKKKTGINPEVFLESSSNIQKYISKLIKIVTVYAVLIILSHALGIQFGSLFTRLSALDETMFDLIGFAVGVFGLSLCCYAQITMGNSWRVGIDEKQKTELITTGIFSLIRNPTYLGLYMLNFGVWIIWPTWTVFVLNLLFVLMLDIQVRCEEDYLSLTHKAVFEEYKRRTKRYIPFVF